MQGCKNLARKQIYSVPGQLSCIRGLVHSFPALESFLFWTLTALLRILFLADLAFMSLKRSKSLRALLFSAAAIRLAHEDAAHFPEMSSDFHALLTTRDRAENGNLAWKRRGNR